jgi:tetratricopeptide (TPR) repeat protein
MRDASADAKAIFLEALESAVDDLPRFLDGACGGDPALRARVEELLRAHRDAGSFLDPEVTRPAATISEAPVAEGAGTVIGPYKLLEQIGEGGFGTVFMAEQTEPIRRKVALKVLKPGMDTKQVVARFEAERQALALMDHPNIARVFDGGATETGRPYFVMELVKGVTITEFCDQNHLNPRQRLELFVQVCQAVQHAHQKGIIHRDVKPSNVLVTMHDATSVVKVIDFGIAKALGQELTDKTVFTGFAQMIGTPLYMSPEQAGQSGLDVDTRSDIYSLGVLLYELLTGTTPFTKDRFKEVGYDEIRRIIREEEPPKPSTRLSDSKDSLPSVAAQRQMEPAKLTRLVRGELDWIVMKALEKDRNRRYETANAFAADVQHHLADEPVLACPPSVLYRFRKFVRRNRVQVALTAAVGLLLAAGGAFGWYFDRQETLRRTEAVQRQMEEESRAMQRRMEEESRKREEQTKRQARLDKDEAATENLLKQCEDALKVDHMAEAALALVAAERRAADGGAEALADRLAKCRADMAVLRELNATNNYRWAWTYDEFGGTPPDNEGVKARLRTALAGYGIVIGKTPATEAARRVTDSLVKERLLAVLDLWLALVPSASERQAGNPDGAWVRAVLKSADSDSYRDAVREGVLTGDDRQLRTVMPALLNQPEALAQPARYAAVLGQFNWVPPDRQRAILLSALRARPGDMEVLMTLGHSYPAKRHDREGVRERVRWFQAAVAVQPRSVGAHNELGSALRDKGDLGEAIAEFRKAVEIEPNDPHSHYNLGIALGMDRWNKASVEESLLHHRRAVELCSDCAVSRTALGLALMQIKKSEEAIAEFRAALKINEKHARAHVSLGLVLHMTTERKDEALVHLRRAVEIDPKDAQTLGALGIVLAQSKNKKDVDEALVHIQAAVKLAPEESTLHSNLGFAWKRKPDVDKAIAEYREAIRLDEMNATAHQYLAQILATGPDRVRDGKQALALATRACELQRWEEPEGIAALAAAHAEVMDFDRACEFQERALSFPAYEKEHGEDGWLILRNYARKLSLMDGNLLPRPELAPPPHVFVRPDPTGALARIDAGNAMWKEKKRKEAIAEFQEAIRLDPKYMPARTTLARALALDGQPDEGIKVLHEALAIEPENARLHNALAGALENRKKLKEAIAEFRKAVELEPDIPGWRNNLSSALEDDDQVDEAIKVLREGILRKPRDTSFRLNLATLLREKGKLDDAIAQLREAIKINGGNEGTYLTLAQVLEEKRDPDGAIAAYRTAIRMNRKMSPAHYLLGLALQKKRDLAGAIASFRKAVQFDDKGFPPFHNALAWSLAVGPDGVRNGAEAVKHATRACELTNWKDSGYLDTLAAAYAEARDFEKAVEFQKKAVSSPGFPKAHLKESQARVELYTQKKPYREPAFAPLPVAPPKNEGSKGEAPKNGPDQ